MKEYIDYSQEVSDAFETGKPIVAIETAGTFEGFDYPENMKLAKAVEDKIRANGCVPAYIGIVNGRIKVGLEEADKLILANPGHMLIKASRRDIPMLITKGYNALTAVASTMMIADMTGIKVVTGGGIGGVHRGVQTTFDISADLKEFVKSDVAVVCSGAKSILDLNLTMEYLETHAVSVVGYKTLELPAYMATHSGIKLDYSFESPEEVAKYISIKKELGIKSGLLLVNPIDEKYSVNSELMNAAIEKAVKKASEEGITGKVITKYILNIVSEEMGGESDEACFHLNVDNADLASRIASFILI